MHRALARKLATFLAPALLAACAAEPDAPQALEPTRQVVDGVEVLAYPETSAGALEWSADTGAVIGDALGTDAYQFDQVVAAGLAADDDGAVYLLDRLGSRVLKYDANGTHLATIGRAGGGPGELQSPIALALGPGDSLWVSEIGGRRVTIYPQDGGEPRTVTYPDHVGFPGTTFAFAGGRVLQDFRVLNFRGPGSGGGAPPGLAGPPGIPLLALNAEAQPIDTLWMADPPPMDQVEVGGAGSRAVMATPRAYAPTFRWAPLPDGGAIVSDSAAYVLHVVAPDGRVTRRILRDPPPRATTDEDRELARERAREGPAPGGGIAIRVEAGPGGVRSSAGAGAGAGGPEMGALAEARARAMRFEDVIPRVAALRTDPAGRIWVGVSERSAGEVDRIDVYDADGALLGELRDVPFPDVFLPDGYGVLTRDEYDVQQLVLYRLRQPEGPVRG